MGPGTETGPIAIKNFQLVTAKFPGLFGAIFPLSSFGVSPSRSLG